MTQEQAVNKLCAWAQEQIGYHEEADNWNKYAAMANVERLYGGSIQNAPWCDLFTDAAFLAVFGLEKGAAMTYQTIGNGSALCRTSAAYFKEHGAFFPSPERGDVIFFYVGGEINHQGIVIRVYGGSVVTVEGNSSDQVAERVYSVSDRKIAGYGRPKWSLVTDGDAPEAQQDGEAGPPAGETRAYTLRLPWLRRGDGGDGSPLRDSVAAMQRQLMGCGISVGRWKDDGDFGVSTEDGVRFFQKKRGLSSDGVVGPETGARLFGGEVVEEKGE